MTLRDYLLRPMQQQVTWKRWLQATLQKLWKVARELRLPTRCNNPSILDLATGPQPSPPAHLEQTVYNITGNENFPMG